MALLGLDTRSRSSKELKLSEHWRKQKTLLEIKKEKLVTG